MSAGVPAQRRRVYVVMAEVRADDKLLTALGAGYVVPGDEELAALLLAWRREIDRSPWPVLVAGGGR